jgi:DNA-binding NarL/FixJ family response regulator
MTHFTAPHAIILLLDSDPIMREVLRDTLHGAGYMVVVAGALGAAVDRLKEIQPDLLITRPYINSMPGRMAAEYLRSKRPGLPVMIVSGFMNDDRVNHQNALEEFHTFPQPFSGDELLEGVRDVLVGIRKS